MGRGDIAEPIALEHLRPLVILRSNLAIIELFTSLLGHGRVPSETRKYRGVEDESDAVADVPNEVKGNGCSELRCLLDAHPPELRGPADDCTKVSALTGGMCYGGNLKMKRTGRHN